jgi:hypothetical protein
MGVAGRVVGGRAGDAVAGEPFRDREDAATAEEVSEDPDDDGCGRLIQCEAVELPAVRRLGRVRMRAKIDKQVPVRRCLRSSFR